MLELFRSSFVGNKNLAGEEQAQVYLLLEVHTFQIFRGLKRQFWKKIRFQTEYYDENNSVNNDFMKKKKKHLA